MPIYTASISPKGIALAAEIADGVIPVWMNPERWDIYDVPLKQGFAKTGGRKSLDNFDVAPSGLRVQQCQQQGMQSHLLGPRQTGQRGDGAGVQPFDEGGDGFSARNGGAAMVREEFVEGCAALGGQDVQLVPPPGAVAPGKAGG